MVISVGKGINASTVQGSYFEYALESAAIGEGATVFSDGFA